MKYTIEQIEYLNGKLLKKTPSIVQPSKRDIAIVVHLFYVDVWQEILHYLRLLKNNYDLFITIPHELTEKEIINIIQDVPHASIYISENRGRDVLPFLHILNLIGTENYNYIAKLHTKKSVTSDNGDAWRKLLYYDLIGSQNIVDNILIEFQTNHALGIVTGKNLILDAIKFDLGNSDKIQELSSLAQVTYSPNYHFPAGTMFWIRSELLRPLLPLIRNNLFTFEDENGQSDHTLAHAVERFFGLLCESQDYQISQSNSDYRNLDKQTLEDLAVLAFTQRFKYDLQLQYKDYVIQDRDRMIQDRDSYILEIVNSKSYKFTKPFRSLPFILSTIKKFQFQKLNIPGTDENRLKLAIKRRIPSKLYTLIVKIAKKRDKQTQKEKIWHLPLSNISHYKGKRVLIVAELSIPQCKKYRVEQKIEMLSYLGYPSDVVSWTDYQEARNLLQLSAMVIFYRIPAHDIVTLLIQEAQRLAIPTFFDVDDLIFEKELLKQNINIQRLPKKEQKEIFKGAELYRQTLTLSQNCISSTEVLGHHMQKHCKGKTYLLPNCLDKDLLKFIHTKPSLAIERENTIKIVYGSGTSTHDIDFLEVSQALLFILEKYPNVHFYLHGTLKLPPKFQAYASQICTIPFMTSDQYYEALQMYDINIAPLEKTIFNHAKSNIKYLEASILRLPTVASDVVEYSKSITHGEDGFLSPDYTSWIDSLELLINDASLREKIANNAYTKVIDQYKIETIANQVMLPMLEEHIMLPTKKKNIIMANVLYHPISFGGATIVIEELSKLIHQHQDYHVTIFTGFFDTDYDLARPYDLVRYEVNTVPVILVRFPEPMSKELEYHNDIMQNVFDKILESIQPNLVHFHSIQQLSASIAKPCMSRNIPYIITLHDMWWLCEKQFMIMPDNTYCHQKKIDTDFCITRCTKNAQYTQERTAYLRPILDNAKLLLTPSSFQAQMYLDNGFDKNKVSVNKNGIIFPSKNYQRSTDKVVRFAYLGGHAVHKGYEHIKNIFESISLSNYELVLVDLHRKLGHHSIFESDWNIKGKLKISDGYTYSQEGLDNFFQSIDVLLFPSQWKESFGLTIREALVRDVWVITTDSGGVVEDIIEGENGNIVSMHDSQSLQEKIESAIHNLDFFSHYKNPYKNQIRSYQEQADELIEYYDRIQT